MTRVKPIENYILRKYTQNPDVESYWLVSIYGSNQGGWEGSPALFYFFAGLLHFLSGQLPRNFKFIVGVLILSPVDWHPFWANCVKREVCEHVQKSEAHALGCRPRGKSSQWSSNSLQTSRIVPAWDSQLKSGKRKQCELCKPVMGAW